MGLLLIGKGEWMRLALYRVSLGLYYLLGGLWAGVILTFALTAPRVFGRLRAWQPEVRPPPGRGPGGAGVGEPLGPGVDRLAGDLVTHILASLNLVQIICATGLVILLVLQCTLFRARLARRAASAANLVRLALLGVAVLALALQLGWLSPRMSTLRQRMYNPRASPASQEEARAMFETYHTLSERTLGSALVLLTAGVVISPFVLTPCDDGRKEPPGHG